MRFSTTLQIFRKQLLQLFTRPPPFYVKLAGAAQAWGPFRPLTPATRVAIVLHLVDAVVVATDCTSRQTWTRTGPFGEMLKEMNTWMRQRNGLGVARPLGCTIKDWKEGVCFFFLRVTADGATGCLHLQLEHIFNFRSFSFVGCATNFFFFFLGPLEMNYGFIDLSNFAPKRTAL